MALLLMHFFVTSAGAAILTTSVTGGNGSIAPLTADFPVGTVVELTTTPAPGYRAAVWTGTDYDSLITSNNFVTMDSEKTVTVQFERIPIVNTETHVLTSQSYYTSDEWLNFASQNGRNLYRESDGTLHMAFVDNYELWYSKSVDDGNSWATEKVPTDLDGKVRYAVMTVDQNGKVYIGFTANPAYNYANNIVSGTNVYRYDVHGVNNVSGSWVVNKLHTSVNGWGYFVSGIAVDADNDVHLFATRYGWYAESQGQQVVEWVWDGGMNSWGGTTQVFHFTTGGNHIVRWYTPTVVDSSGVITLFGKRNTSGDDVLFYVTNSGDSWGTPVTIEANMDATWNGQTTLDAAIDSNDVIHLVYFTNNDAGQTETIYSDDLGVTKSVIYTGTVGQRFYDLKIHSDAEGNLTTILRREGESTAVLKMTAGDASLPTAVDLPTVAPDGDVYYLSIAQTDTANGLFTGCELFYVDNETASPPKPATPPYGPYGPIELYYNNLAGFNPEPAVLTLTMTYSAANISTTNLLSSALVMNILQMKPDLPSGSWSNLYSVSGVTETNWTMPLTTTNCFFRIKTW